MCMVVVTRAQKRLLMAENMADQEPQLQNPEPQDDSSDNESVISNEPDNTQDLSRLEYQLKNEMGAIAAQVKETVLGLNQQMETKFTELDKQIHNLEVHLQDQNNNQSMGQPSRNSTVMRLNPNSNFTSENMPSALSSNGTESSASHAPVGSELQNSSSNNGISASQHTRADNFIKLKPQNFTGSDDDFEDFLTQFEITSEINGWDYKSKSLYLANCLTGVARALLNELTAEQRRDYDSLVQKLTERYGSENRAEVFRSQLKSRVKAKGETTAQLAQAIRKLTRQAYPRVSLDVVEALAVDHFVDALPEAQIRLRLREVGPSTLAEAEKIAVRMEANITADKQRTRFVGKVEQTDQNKGSQNQTTEQQMENISKRIDMLSRSVQNLTQQQRPRMPANARNFPPQNQYNFPRPNRPDNRNMSFQRNYQSRGGNPNFNQQNNGHAQAQRNQVRPQGNFRQPAQGSAARLN